MNLFDTHIYKLRFHIDDAPNKYMERWNEFKKKCESGENKHIVEQIKGYCKLESNKNLPYLEREEGGFGGNNNTIHKQIRFRDYWGENDFRYTKDNDIIFNEITNTETEKWTCEELDDLIYAFIKTANNNLNAKCVNGSIEMINKSALSDSYLDSDSE